MDRIKNLPLEEKLTQLAEECGELIHASLQLRRVITGMNPTTKTREDAVEHLKEEVADVLCCVRVLPLSTQDQVEIEDIVGHKMRRWQRRLEKAYGR